MAIKPIVDGIEQEFEGKLNVMRINIHEPVGEILGRKYDFQYTPTFIFFNPAGEEEWRIVGMLNPEKVRASMDHP